MYVYVYLSFALVGVQPFIIMTLCDKRVHYVFGSSNTNENGTIDQQSSLHLHQDTTSRGQKPPDDTEGTPHFPILFGPSETMSTRTKRETGGIGFVDDAGGSTVDGLMSCTESIGFESSDERSVDDQIENLDVTEELCWRRGPTARPKWKREGVKREVKQFPPPLSSLNQDGKPTFHLRPVRKDGKLELHQVKIPLPVTLRASRQDGRLRLHVIKKEDKDIENEYEEEEQMEGRAVVEEEDMQENQEDAEEMGEGKAAQEESEDKVEERAEGWQIPASPGGVGEGYPRCHGQLSHHQNHHHHHHHDLHVWRQHCVTIS